jgi:catechol 2,3-dioxygenase-like lactoylglutathione lyase family enzyme
MPRVVGIDHLVLRVSDLEKSREFYDYVLKFLGFRLLDEYEDMVGWTNGKTRLWIGQADAAGKERPHHFGDIGFHHYAFELEKRADVDALYEHVRKRGIKVVDPAAEYYDDYYAVFFLDPDGMKFEGMKYGEMKQKRAKKRAKAKSKSSTQRKRRKRK